MLSPLSDKEMAANLAGATSRVWPAKWRKPRSVALDDPEPARSWMLSAFSIRPDRQSRRRPGRRPTWHVLRHGSLRRSLSVESRCAALYRLHQGRAAGTIAWRHSAQIPHGRDLWARLREILRMACRRNLVDQPVGIKILKRYVADHQKSLKGSVFSKEMITNHQADSMRVAVVGGGPAGVSCAYHLLLRGYHVDVLEAAEQAGGMARSGIPATGFPRTS